MFWNIRSLIPRYASSGYTARISNCALIDCSYSDAAANITGTSILSDGGRSRAIA